MEIPEDGRSTMKTKNPCGGGQTGKKLSVGSLDIF